MNKSRDAFRTISEVAELLDTPAHVLRFWESKFTQVKPVKRAGGRRYYRPGDIALIAGIRKLLHEDGLTIKGVQKVLREQGVKHVATLVPLPIDEAQDAEHVEDAPYTEVLAETATVLPFAPVEDTSAKAPHGADQTDPVSPGPDPSDLPDFVTQSLEDRANDDTVVDTKPPEDPAKLPEAMSEPPDAAPVAPDSAEPSHEAETSPNAGTTLAGPPEDERSESSPVLPFQPDAPEEQDIDARPACEDDTPDAPETMRQPLEDLPPAPDAHAAEPSPDAPTTKPDDLDGSDDVSSALRGEEDAATPAPDIEAPPGTIGEDHAARPGLPDAASAPVDDAPLTAPAEGTEPAEDRPAEAHTSLPPMPTPEDTPAASPGLLAHLAGIDRLSPEQSARIAPQLAALRALLDRPEQAPRK